MDWIDIHYENWKQLPTDKITKTLISDFPPPHNFRNTFFWDPFWFPFFFFFFFFKLLILIILLCSLFCVRYVLDTNYDFFLLSFCRRGKTLLHRFDDVNTSNLTYTRQYDIIIFPGQDLRLQELFVDILFLQVQSNWVTYIDIYIIYTFWTPFPPSFLPKKYWRLTLSTLLYIFQEIRFPPFWVSIDCCIILRISFF